jgi:Xaa-Pro aminopeptidase
MKPIFDRGYRSGHVCGHSIGMTMIEMPRIGEGFDFVLPENMVCSMHPHFMTQDRTHSLYFQETYRVEGIGEALSGFSRCTTAASERNSFMMMPEYRPSSRSFNQPGLLYARGRCEC